MTLKNVFATIKNLFRRDGSADSQRHQVEYTAEIKNNSETDQEVSVLMPYITSQGEYQVVLTQPVFNPEAHDTLSDLLFNNQVAVWRGTIQAKSVQQIKQSCQIEVRPRDEEIPNDAVIDQYATNQAISYNGDSIDSSNPAIITTAEMLKDPQGSIATTIKNINDYVVSSLTYGKPIDGLYTSQQAIENDCVDCGGFDTLMIALLGAVGIPSRLVSGFWLDNKKNDMHAWLEILLPDGTWVVADPSIENLRKQGRTRKQGLVGKAGSDRLVMSVGSDLQVTIGGSQVSIPILQHPHVISSNSEVVSVSAAITIDS